ncbi:SH3 domain-containing protein [Moelleriella libera RCEF 2490]|uniref:SH3 domain-containing protein n=1 Tax=Moelleriella libera RCEF 2490 TaxID=1081109 RepID=A0A167ZEW7_9HYPO|nr:SH3 domain-containing protein [Moelleriella libera RCEF 2490]
MAASFRVKALYEYSSPHEDDLNFGIGQIITVTEEEDDEWYCGQYLDDQGIKREGIFPRNFVEKFEPTAPPRPTRARPKKEPEAPQHEDDDNTSIPAPPDPTEKTTTVDETEKESVPTSSNVPPAAERTVPAIPTSAPTKPAPAAAASAKSPTVADASSTSARPAESSGQKPKPAPPPVSEKPLSNSFKDRIAAFNKPAAPPIAPFKPSSLGGGGGGPSGFVKKSFVAPPPSRDAYIPISREKPPPPTVYRREEDPEIKEQEAETLDQAERAGLVPADQPQQGDDEDQPKPTSLKERIALLQKQQMEQAQRHAEAAAKKEKPKKPQKKKTEAAGPGEDDAADTEGRRSLSTEHIDSAEVESRASIDGLQESGFPNRRRNLKGPIADEFHDGNEADMSGAGDTTEGQDDTTEREDGEEVSRHARRMPTGSHAAPAATQHDVRQQAAEPGDEVKQADDEEEDEDDDVDPEARRKAELRARMAKMSGGMGFHGMFGAPMSPVGPAASEKRISKAAETSGIDEEAEDAASNRVAPPVFTPMALPGMGNTLTSSRSRQDKGQANEDEVDDGSIPSSSSKTAPPPIPTRVAAKSHTSDDEEEDEVTTPAPISGAISVRPDIGPPPIPGGRPPPPSIPKDSARAPPPPPPAELKSPTDGSESDDELSGGAKDKDLEQAGLRSARSPPLSPRVEGSLPSSPPTSSGKRNSRPPPPIPVMTPGLPPATGRPPPPPPPGQMSRQTTADTVVATPTRPPQAGEEDDEEITEYEGDYDTDIGSSVPHKDALKAHIREPSLEESTIKSPTRDAPPGAPPPIPSAAAPRAIPPPIPSQPPPENKRRSVDAPRAAPPPPPAKDAPSLTQNMDDYDPYNHSATPGPPPMGPNYGMRTPKIDEDYAYFPDAAATAALSSPERRAPPTAPPARPSNKQSLDLPRRSTSNKRSMDMHRPSVESDFIANDVDLSAQSVWWKQANQVPPVFEGRKDVHIESEETTTTNQGAKTVITRDIFVLFQDYSQTIVTVRFDPYNATDAEMEQRHEPPPRTLRQDQMEEYYDQFGRQISNAANSRKDTVVGDGTPQGFVMELLRPLSGALPPVGTRSYGALVYANMANASTQQQDVIRAGDIISFRNAKFQGKHGPMHAKYSAEVGRPDHVAVVAEWDGTKKKVRAWEQGRENKKIKMESYKLDDLRSGEVKIWRVVPRTWVGWSIQR